jgi:hypothetical protein
MNQERRFEAWKERRGGDPAPPGFTQRVMAAVMAEVQATEIRRRTGLAALLAALWSARVSRIGVLLLAAVACVLRLSHVVAIFLIW